MNEKARILVVDDDEGLRKSLGLIINSKSYRVETAGTGQEALQKAWGKDIKVALVDLKLPDMEGMNLIAPLKEMHPELSVIVITGFASIETAIQALNKGASAYITKPLNIDELCAKVEEALEKQRLLAENKRLLLELQRELDERKRAETERKKFKTIADRAGYGAGIIDLAGNLIYINEAFARMHGYAVEELLGKHFSILHTEEQMRNVERLIEHLRQKGSFVNEEVWHKRRDGAVFPTLMTGTYIGDDKDNPAYLSASAIDITERIMAEKALRDSEEHYSALVKNLTDAVFLFKDGVITWCNDKVEEIYGYPKEELLGKRARFFYPNNINPSEFTRILSSALKERGLFNSTTRFQRKNGSIVDIEYSLLQISGKAPIEIIAVARDITERKLVERERERLLAELVDKTKELEQIIYVTSHDLRSPLVNIQGFTRELGQACTQLYEALNSKDVPSALRERLAPTLNEDVPSALQHILASSSKMDSLLSGLLRLSRLGRTALNITRLDMNKLMSEVVASFEFLAKETGATVKVEELPTCYGDETQINQVFSNLLDNSLKFLDPERPGIITISGKEDKGQAIYCVEDNGIGIAEKDKDMIFEIFHRLNHDAKRGEGLGLTIVRKMLDRHGGKVWVESELDQGSRFFVSLPNKERAK